MDRAEHLLMLAVFVRQQLFIDRIVEVLKAKVLANPDRKAWDELRRAPIPWDTAFHSRVREQYNLLAKELGIEVVLDTH